MLKLTKKQKQSLDRLEQIAPLSNNPELDCLAEKALQSLRERSCVDIREWAKNLARDVIHADD